MGRRGLVLVGVLLAAAGCTQTERRGDPPAPTTEYTSDQGVRITVDQPLARAVVESPLEVKGRAPGTWSFEADFQVDVLDAERRTVVEGFATMQGEWMTEDDVDFAGTVEFEPPASAKGFVVLRKANPSGLRKNDDSVEIPVRFEP